MSNKFWSHIESRLEKMEGSIYFAGGTLCVDLPKGGVGMNLNGKGFVFGNNYPFMKNSKVYLPEHITQKVRETYLEVKGCTDHYKETVLGN